MPTNGEMSRRSARLGTKDLPDDDAASTSSTGSTGTGQVSYRETPVRIFKRKTGGRKQTGSSRTSSRASSVSSETVTQSNEPVQTDRYPSVLSSPSVRSTASVLRSPLMRSSNSSHHQLEPPGFSSGYSSSEEAYYRPSLSPSASTSASGKGTASSLQSPAPAEFDLRDALRSPAQSLVMVYWWMGSAWYSLTSGISALDVFLLSRRTVRVRKTLLFILLFLLLAFGLWYWYPHISRGLSRLSVKSKPSPVQQAQPPPVQHSRVHDDIPSASLSALKEEIYRTLREQETRWSENSARDLESVKREITLLKQDEEKQRQVAEILQSDIKTLQNDRVKITSVQSEEQSSLGQEIAGVQQQITVLRAEVSELRAASDSLQDRITSQEASQIKAAAQLKEELVSWLLEKISSERQSQLQPQPLPLPEDVVLQPHLQGALEALEQRLLKRLAEEKQESEKLDAWRTVGETLRKEGVGAITVQDVEQIVQRALSLYRADGIGMADYALESSGASVINTRCSETYRTRSACLSLFGFPLWYHSESPRTVIQPELYPGKCWAFRGSEGFLVIALSYPVRITHVTLEHLPKVLSPTGRIDSAPRNFAVYGMSSEHEEGTLLETFTYEQNAQPVQTFKLTAPAKDVYRMVELRILSNWGHQEYTCVYRFRVHGEAQVDGEAQQRGGVRE